MDTISSAATTIGSPAVADGPVPVEKAPTGIAGFDEITGGGLPRGRATLVTGRAGSGKTLFGLEFLVRGAREFHEPGVFLAFEESHAELAANAASMAFDLPALEQAGLLRLDALHLDTTTMVQTGEFDLEGLFIRLEAAIEAVGARRVVLDTLEVLFAAFGNEAIVRSELSRLLRWLKDRGMTVVLTGEPGRHGELTKFGIEEFVTDCVVVLDTRVDSEVSTRRLRVAKYRGSAHGANEYPFLLTDGGFTIVPLSSIGLSYAVSSERVSTGVPRLDHMLGGGVYRGTTTLVSGSPGTGKSSLAATAALAGCARGERVLLLSYEESPAQLQRNMTSIGLDLGAAQESGLLTIVASRPTEYGLEAHLAHLYRLLDDVEPSLVVLDAVASLDHAGSRAEVASALIRQVDMIRGRGVTAFLTTLTHDRQAESSTLAISSLVDTWLLLRNVESGGERTRLLFVIKSRGTAHSNQVREFVLTDGGPQLLDVYVAGGGVLTGSARLERLAAEAAQSQADLDERTRVRAAHVRHAARVEHEIATLRDELSAAEEALLTAETAALRQATLNAGRRVAMAEHRWADPTAADDEDVTP